MKSVEKDSEERKVHERLTSIAWNGKMDFYILVMFCRLPLCVTTVKPEVMSLSWILLIAAERWVKMAFQWTTTNWAKNCVCWCVVCNVKTERERKKMKMKMYASLKLDVRECAFKYFVHHTCTNFFFHSLKAHKTDGNNSRYVYGNFEIVLT